MQINWNWITSYSGNGTNFANLEDYSDVLDLTQFSQDSLDQCKADGKLMAVPVALTGRLFYWNKTTFDEAVRFLRMFLFLWSGVEPSHIYNEDYYPLAMMEYDRAEALPSIIIWRVYTANRGLRTVSFSTQPRRFRQAWTS